MATSKIKNQKDGIMQPASDDAPTMGLYDTNTPQRQAEYQAQASARYAAMFSQILDITVPMNLSLRAGHVIDVKFPDLNTGKPEDKNSPESGKYMIAKLSHEFGNPKGDFTGLSLVRDSFTINE